MCLTWCEYLKKTIDRRFMIYNKRVGNEIDEKYEVRKDLKSNFITLVLVLLVLHNTERSALKYIKPIIAVDRTHAR